MCDIESDIGKRAEMIVRLGKLECFLFLLVGGVGGPAYLFTKIFILETLA